MHRKYWFPLFVCPFILLFLFTFILSLSRAQENDLYKALGISRGASSSEVKQAYKKLALRWHPDKNPGDDEASKKYIEISNAYKILSDKDKREHYDRLGYETQRYDGTRRSSFRFRYGGPFDDSGFSEFDHFEFFFGQNRFEKRQRYSIPSKTTLLNTYNFENFVKKDELWIIEFFSEYCKLCFEKAELWEQLHLHLKGIIKMGRVDVNSNPIWNRKFSVYSVPTILSLKRWKPIYYNGPFELLPLLQYANSLLQNPTIRFVNNVRDWQDFCEEYPSMVKVLVMVANDFSPNQFSERLEEIVLSLVMKYAYSRWKRSMVFVLSQQQKMENSELAAYFQIKHLPSIILQKENYMKFEMMDLVEFSFGAYQPSDNYLLKESICEFLEMNQFLHVPQLHSWNYESLCGIEKFCVILVGRSSNISLVTRLKTLATMSETVLLNKIQFSWIEFDEQSDFCHHFGIHEENLSSSSSLLFLHHKEMRFAAYDWLSSNESDLEAWIKSVLDGNIKMQISKVPIPTLIEFKYFCSKLIDLDLEFVVDTMHNVFSFLFLDRFLVTSFLIYPLIMYCCSYHQEIRENNRRSNSPTESY